MEVWLWGESKKVQGRWWQESRNRKDDETQLAVSGKWLAEIHRHGEMKVKKLTHSFVTLKKT